MSCGPCFRKRCIGNNNVDCEPDWFQVGTASAATRTEALQPRLTAVHMKALYTVTFLQAVQYSRARQHLSLSPLSTTSHQPINVLPRAK